MLALKAARIDSQWCDRHLNDLPVELVQRHTNEVAKDEANIEKGCWNVSKLIRFCHLFQSRWY